MQLWGVHAVAAWLVAAEAAMITWYLNVNIILTAVMLLDCNG
jgi:hypothetical protein